MLLFNCACSFCLDLYPLAWILKFLLLSIKGVPKLENGTGVVEPVVIACIFGFKLICIWPFLNMAISISYTGCQVSTLKFDIGNWHTLAYRYCVALSCHVIRVHIYIYMFALLMMIIAGQSSASLLL